MSFSVWEQLGQLKLLTMRLGVLHEAQIKQLKIWPRVFFQNSNKSQFSVDIEKKSIVFDVWQNSSKDNALEKKAPEILDQNTKELLGDDWSVRIVLHYPKKKDVIHRFYRKVPEIVPPSKRKA